MSSEPGKPASDKRSSRSPEELKDRILFMQVCLNFLVAISTIVAGSFGFWRYLETRRVESEQRMEAAKKAEEDSARLAQQRLKHDQESLDLRRKEFRVKFFEREMELYIDACRTAAALASAPDPKNLEVARDIERFYRLYWGELCVVEGPAVEHAMVAFEQSLRTWRERGSGLATDDMKVAACNLAFACRNSLEGNFDLNLGDLPTKPHAFMREIRSTGGKETSGHVHDGAQKP